MAWELDIDIKDLGSLRARVHADTAYIWEDSARTVMFPVEVKLYDENGAQTANLTADEGELDSNTNRMVARGNVVLVTTDDQPDPDRGAPLRSPPGPDLERRPYGHVRGRVPARRVRLRSG